MTTNELIARLKALPRTPISNPNGCPDYPDIVMIEADDVDALIAEAEGECPECGGTGKEEISIAGMGGLIHACPACKGTGRLKP